MEQGGYQLPAYEPYRMKLLKQLGLRDEDIFDHNRRGK
jgi:hypothetical protein